MRDLTEKKVENILMEAGLISPQRLEELKSIGEKTGKKIDRILLSGEVIKYKEDLSVIAQGMGVEFIDLENTKINKDAILALNGDTARRYSVFPFEIKNNLLYLAMENPDDIFLIDEIKVFTQVEIKPFLADRRMITGAIDYFYSSEAKLEKDGLDMPGKVIHLKEKAANEIHPKAQVNEIPVCSEVCSPRELIGRIVNKGCKIGATHLHFDLIDNIPRVRYRADNILLEQEAFVFSNYNEILNELEQMAGFGSNEAGMPQRGVVYFDAGDKTPVCIQISILPTINGKKLLLKLNNSGISASLNGLGFIGSELNAIQSMLDESAGLIVVTGPEGSGKSTTCYALLKKLLERNADIISFERRVQSIITGVNQVQAGDRWDFALMSLLEAGAEHDPDVLMVDMELGLTELSYLLNMALGGKLVIITAPFTGVCEALAGLNAMGIEPYILAAVSVGIIAQQLVRKQCPLCKNRNSVLFESHTGTAETERKKAHCEACDGRGYRGKTGLYEVLYLNDEYRKLIINNEGLTLLTARFQNERSTFKNNCIRLVNDDITSREEIVRHGMGENILNL